MKYKITNVEKNFKITPALGEYWTVRDTPTTVYQRVVDTVGLALSHDKEFSQDKFYSININTGDLVWFGRRSDNIVILQPVGEVVFSPA